MKHRLMVRWTGFTLIEMVTVIAVIGILVTLGLGPIQSARQRGRDTTRKSDLQLIAQALDLYYAENRTYPQAAGTCNYASTQQSVTNPSTSWIPGLEPYITSSQDRQTPRDPRQSAIYKYEYFTGSCLAAVPGGLTNTTGLSYVLVAALENSNDIEGITVSGKRYYRVLR